ncbi:MAG: DUF4234 domain-containing protein [Asgard group archaeon]|nr:DUF4234 domain-containing protein [Asgard group archaeon]
MTQESIYGTKRKYRRVILISLITFGIYYLIYQWWLFRDLDEHFRNAFKAEPESYPTKNNPTTMFIFTILLPIYSIYTKYQLLHEHIATSNIESGSNCKSGYRALLFYLLFGISTLGIVPLLMEIEWQKAFNEHVDAHKHKDNSELK